DVVAAVAVQRVAAEPADQDVVAAAAQQGVVAAPAHQNVGGRAPLGVERVVRVAAEEDGRHGQAPDQPDPVGAPVAVDDHVREGQAPRGRHGPSVVPLELMVTPLPAAGPRTSVSAPGVPRTSSACRLAFAGSAMTCTVAGRVVTVRAAG